MELILGAAGVLLFEVLAWRYGYDSRDGFERHESRLRDAWMEEAAARRAVLGARLGALFGPR